MINLRDTHTRTTDWGEVTREQAIAKGDDAYYVYFASKILAERAMWDFAKEHPKLDVSCGQFSALLGGSAL